MEYANVLIDYLKEKYNSLECVIEGNKNIKRYTKPSMSNYTENAIALLINKIKKNQLNYLIDPQLSVDNKKIIRPDIIIYDKDNVIVGIIEVKSQLGYAGNFNQEDYNQKIKQLKKTSDKHLLALKKQNINFSISDNCKNFIVILMSSNNHNNLEKFKDTNYFVLFEKEKNKNLWYDTLSLETLNEKKHGYFDFIEFVKKI